MVGAVIVRPATFLAPEHGRVVATVAELRFVNHGRYFDEAAVFSLFELVRVTLVCPCYGNRVVSLPLHQDFTLGLQGKELLFIKVLHIVEIIAR